MIPISMLRLRPLAFVFAAFLFDCATLDKIEAGTCGNGVVDTDKDEDCDSFAIADGDKKLTCGAPAAGASACRYVCATDAECPTGWGCSVAGTCASPSGTFITSKDLVSTGVVTMVTGDFDGDGRRDILGSGARGADNAARARIHFFEEEGVLADVVALSAPLASPAVRDFDLDGLDDFAFGAGGLGGFGVMTGQADRTFVPVMFPVSKLEGLDVKAVLVSATKGRLLPTGGRAEFVFAGSATTSSQKQNLLFTLNADGNYTRALPVGPDGINAAPVWADLFPGDPTSTCGEIIVPMKLGDGKGEIQIFSPCKPGILPGRSAWSELRAPLIITDVDPGSTVHVARVNGDPRLGIVFAKAGTKKLAVAHTDGTTITNVVEGEIPGSEVPLASGDLNADGAVDYVTPTSLIVSVGGDGGADAGAGGLVLFPAPRRARWTNARIANLNGDDIPDLVAASSEQPDIDFFSGVQGQELTPSTIATNGPVSFLAVGDYDGDRLADIAFVEGRAGSEKTDVAVAYGRPFGPPEPPRTVGRIAEVSQIEPLPYETPNSLAIFLRQTTSGSSAPPALAIAILIGSGDRQPLAPLLLGDGAAKTPLPSASKLQRTWAPLSVIAGPVSKTDRIDLLGLAVGYTYDELNQPQSPFPSGLWLASGTGPSAFASAREIVSFPPTFEAIDEPTQSYVLPTASGDLDGDGIVEVVTLARGKNDRSSIVVSRLKDDAPSVTPLEVSGLATIGPSSSLELADVDGDGALDLGAVVYGAPSSTSGAPGAAPKLVIFFNDGKGSFGAEGVTIELPAQPQGRRTETGTTGFTMVTTGEGPPGGRPHRELAVATQRRLLLFALRPDKRGFDLTQELAPDLSAVTGVVSGDFDGDGIEDLALADGGSIRMFRQRSKQEKRGEVK